jgi:hypothetical protein
MSEQPDRSQPVLDLAVLLGQRRAFSLVAGACMAADAECLRRIREDKAYRALNVTWDQFCREHFGITRPVVDKMIRQLEEFGPAFFELSGILHITPDQYRQIAGSVDAEGLLYEGEKIPIIAGNIAKLMRAVDALLSRAALSEPQPVAARAGESAEHALAEAEKALDRTVADLTRLNALSLDADVRSRIHTVALAARERLDQILLSAAA